MRKSRIVHNEHGRVACKLARNAATWQVECCSSLNAALPIAHGHLLGDAKLHCSFYECSGSNIAVGMGVQQVTVSSRQQVQRAKAANACTHSLLKQARATVTSCCCYCCCCSGRTGNLRIRSGSRDYHSACRLHRPAGAPARRGSSGVAQYLCTIGGRGSRGTASSSPCTCISMVNKRPAHPTQTQRP